MQLDLGKLEGVYLRLTPKQYQTIWEIINRNPSPLIREYGGQLIALLITDILTYELGYCFYHGVSLYSETYNGIKEEVTDEEWLTLREIANGFRSVLAPHWKYFCVFMQNDIIMVTWEI